MYPAPATSNFANPSGSPISATISSAILRGALRSVRASSNETGSANSPNSIFGGCSTTMFASSMSYFCFRKARTCAIRRFCNKRYTVIPCSGGTLQALAMSGQTTIVRDAGQSLPPSS